MASSRIFIKGLPPTLSEHEFKEHFSKQQAITDAKLIPHRRIGYVGYKSPEEAAKAVKYFNKSFIRMSKIGVEIARPISDTTLPLSRKAHREHAINSRRNDSAARSANLPESSSLKRKRSDVDDSDPKLKEFLEIMQSKSQPKSWEALNSNEKDAEGPPHKMQAMELPEAESDNEYETVPKKSKLIRGSPTLAAVAPTNDLVGSNIATEPLREDTAESQRGDRVIELDATDEDWLRSRKSRLLDLTDLDDALKPTPEARSSSSPHEPLSAPVTDLASSGNARNETFLPAEHSLETLDPTVEDIKVSGRLFVRNLPYTATEDDLRTHFESYGALKEVHLPVDASGISKGFALIQFHDPAEAVEAYHNADGEAFQGRLLHILPAAPKREGKLDEFAIAKLPLKKQKQIKKKAEASTSTFNWNSLYMNQDAVNASIAERLGVSKSELLDPTSADAGVKQAIAETSIIQETKAYFSKYGVDLNAFKKRERGDTTILVKNFPYGMSMDELRTMFEEFGPVLRVLMPPSGTIAIIEFSQALHARAAFASLAYRRIKDSVLFLERGPKGLFTGVSDHATHHEPNEEKNSIGHKLSAADILENGTEPTCGDSSTLFVRNLNFNTNTARLTEVFKPLDGFLSARVNTKTDSKKPGQVLSMGFGFLEFRSKAQAQAALTAMDGYSLDGHKLVIKASHKGLDAAEEWRKDDRIKKLAGKRTKIIIKNLPLEATQKDVRALFGTYGQLRSVRLPKKFDRSTRGFAFADFISPREAENALESLKDTHLLGRRLVLEFAAEDAVDAEEEIEKMQRKVGKQVSKVALQKLTQGGRKKFNIEGNENGDDQ